MNTPDSAPARATIDLARMDWQVVDDGVMGGLSRGEVRLESGRLVFRGQLSTANGGGFSSIRGTLPHPLEARQLAGFRLLAFGDGREYQLRLRDSLDSNAIAFQALFHAAPEARRIEFGMADFEPVIRGRRVEVLPPLSGRVVRHLGFMLRSDRPGPFKLEIEALEALRGATGNG